MQTKPFHEELLSKVHTNYSILMDTMRECVDPYFGLTTARPHHTYHRTYLWKLKRFETIVQGQAQKIVPSSRENLKPGHWVWCFLGSIYESYPIKSSITEEQQKIMDYYDFHPDSEQTERVCDETLCMDVCSDKYLTNKDFDW